MGLFKSKRSKSAKKLDRSAGLLLVLFGAFIAILDEDRRVVIGYGLVVLGLMFLAKSFFSKE